MKMAIDKEWFEKRAAAEGDHEISVGGNRKTMTLNLTDEELAQLERLATPNKVELRKIYQRWAAEEIEAIELIEAVGKYLGLSRTPPQRAEGETQNGTTA